MPEEQWSESERWAWQEVCAGRVADFNVRDGNELDPRTPDGWNEGRKLRSEFLKEILFREPFRGVIPVEGVRVIGAWFSQLVDLAHGRVNGQLWLEKCRFDRAINLLKLQIDGWLSLRDRSFRNDGLDGMSVYLSRGRISGDVNMRGAAFQQADLKGAKVGGQLDLSGAKVAGKLILNGVTVGHLFMHGPNATFQDVDLVGATVDGVVDMTGATVGGALNLDGLEVRRDLFMRGPHALFQDVRLRGAKVDGQLGMVGATVAGTLNMGDLEVGRSLHMRGPDATFREVDLRGAKVGGQLDLSGATVAGKLIMNGLTVGQSLFMRGPNAAFQDVDLVGATVDGVVDMTGATVGGTLNMAALEVRRALFMQGPHATFQDVNLGSAIVEGQLGMAGATVAGRLYMGSLTVGQSLFMPGPNAAFRDVDLRGAKIGGQVNMSGASVAGQLIMNGFEVGRSLYMRGPHATFREVDLVSAKVNGLVDMTGANVVGQLNMGSLKVEQHLLMSEGATFQDVDLRGAKVGGQLAMVGATVAGTLIMDNLEVDRDLFIWTATFKKRIRLTFSHIGGNLDLSGADLSGAEFSEFELAATRVEGELRLVSGDHPPPAWRHGARLVLRNTHAGVLQDRSDAWPTELQLDGFTYGRLGSLLARDIEWYIQWLARDRSYTPQPYEHLAAVFRAAGEPTKADRILYESRERARRKTGWPGWLGLSLLKWTIGYGLGLRYFRALWWVGATTLIGTIFLACSGQGPAGGAPKAVYSLDQLLPIVEVANYDGVVLTGGVFYYFVAHKLIGWLLGSFLVAGLAGLTQK